MSETRRRRFEIDEETGEVIEFIEWREGDRLRTEKQKEYFYDKMERYSDKTDFVWLKFAYNQNFYGSISSVNLTRLMFFSTFCNDSCYVMQDGDIKSTLNINANQVKAFRNELFSEIVVKDNSRLYLNDNLFGKGKIKESDKDYIRLFTESTRQLYSSCKTTSEHAYLAYFFRMMPFVNRQTNILCCSQEEQNRKNIAYMTIAEFLNLIGATHHGRLKKQLQSYRINGELVIGFFNTFGTLSPKGKYAVINPILYYGGDRTSQNYLDIRKMFADEKATYLSSPY